MTRLPILKAATAEEALFKLSLKKMRQKGSHAFYRHPDGRTTTLPHHKGRDLARPLLRQILREIEINLEEFREILEDVS